MHEKPRPFRPSQKHARDFQLDFVVLHLGIPRNPPTGFTRRIIRIRKQWPITRNPEIFLWSGTKGFCTLPFQPVLGPLAIQNSRKKRWRVLPRIHLFRAHFATGHTQVGVFDEGTLKPSTRFRRPSTVSGAYRYVDDVHIIRHAWIKLYNVFSGSSYARCMETSRYIGAQFIGKRRAQWSLDFGGSTYGFTNCSTHQIGHLSEYN